MVVKTSLSICLNGGDAEYPDVDPDVYAPGIFYFIGKIFR